MERKEGEIFQYKGVRLLVCVDPSNSCTGCYLDGKDCQSDQILNITGNCGNDLRKDKMNVIFKEIKTENKSILSEGEEIVNGSRHSDYGDAKESFSRIATIASVMTGKELAPEDCCAVLMAVKLVRESFAHKRDNLVDLCGYAHIMNELNENESEKEGE